MQSRIKIEISAFGAFRQWADSELFTFEMSHGVNIGEIRAALREEITRRHPDFREHKLLDVSALADETAILRNHHILLQDTKLAILPPISGG